MSLFQNELIKNIGRTGELPQVETVVILDEKSINRTLIMILLVIIISIIFAKVATAFAAKFSS